MRNYIIIFISLLVFTSSCKKELGKLPENAKVDGNTIIDERTARVALNGVYYKFANVQSENNVTDWQNNEVYPAMFSGNIGYGYGEMDEEINLYGIRSDYFWKNCYEIINGANGVINSVDELPDNFFVGAAKQEIMGEARFLRAYASFKLLTYYGEWFDLTSSYGVLLRDELVDLGNIKKKRSSVTESYDFIMSDVEYAMDNAPTENSSIYATKFTAMALKMRVLMSHGESADYTETISLADRIIADGGYSLEANPRDIFYTKGLGSEEVILGVRPQQNQEAYYYNVSSQYWPGASSLYVAKQQLKDLLDGDPRQEWLIGSENDYTENTYFFTKYIKEGTTSTLISESAYAFRLTEVYLLKAEAIVRSGGNINDAKLIVKDIMTHAGVTDFSAIDNASTTDDVLLQIYYEVVRSLVGEDGQEWMALLRLPFATVQEIRPSITDKLQYVLPVPTTEFLNNPVFGEAEQGLPKLLKLYKKKNMNRYFKILVAVLIFPAMLFGQQLKKNGASIKGNIKGLKDNEVYISFHDADSAKTDTVRVKDGKFMWSGNIPDPQKIYIGTKQRYMEVFMENSPVTITGNIDSFYYSTVKGSSVHNEYKAFDKSISDITAVEYSLYQKLHDLKDGSEADKAIVEKQIDSFRSKRRGRMMDYISTYPSSAVSVSMIEDMAMMGEFSSIDSLYKKLTPAAQQTITGKRLGKRLEVLKRSAMGEPITDFVQADVNGKPVKISDFKGKYVFIDFWASWCGPCRAENPNVLKAYNTFKDKNFTVLGISLDDNADKWKEAIEKDGMPWTQVSDLKGFRNEVANYYGVQGIPYSFLIDPNGNIIEKGLRGTELHAKLAEILQ